MGHLSRHAEKIEDDRRGRAAIRFDPRLPVGRDPLRIGRRLHPLQPADRAAQVHEPSAVAAGLAKELGEADLPGLRLFHPLSRGLQRGPDFKPCLPVASAEHGIVTHHGEGCRRCSQMLRCFPGHGRLSGNDHGISNSRLGLLRRQQRINGHNPLGFPARPPGPLHPTAQPQKQDRRSHHQPDHSSLPGAVKDQGTSGASSVWVAGKIPVAHTPPLPPPQHPAASGAFFSTSCAGTLAGM